jgi:sugar phosphate isomerase/epimerase
MAQDRAPDMIVASATPWSRRGFLAGAGAMAAMQAVPAHGLGQQLFFDKVSPVGLQLFSVLEALAVDLDATFAQISGMGFGTVEAVPTMPGTATAIRAALDAAGLTCRSGHFFPEAVPGLAGLNFTDNLSEIIDHAGVIGLNYTVMAFSPAPPRLGGAAVGEDLGQFFARITPQLTADDWRSLADGLNRTGALLDRAGLRLAYHNHDRELLPYGDRNALEILIENTDPSLVSFELDAGWACQAGIDPVALLDNHPGRFRLVHLKEFVPVGGDTTHYSSAVSLGTNGTDWTAILHAARRAGVDSYYVEHEPPFTHPALELAADSAHFLARVPA